MSPDVLVVDEIGRQEDALAIREALHAGIRVIATAHGMNVEDIRKRPGLQDLFREQLFSRYVVLWRVKGKPPQVTVYDHDGQQITAHSAQHEVNSSYA
ncbi:MAG: hypothetical protein A2189_03845 [Paenibacillus sp. RIFOXYA1_FULL_44_5]|nr:MAG: hypothetical protein A2189_03845 [Paenibacillus sp. RIFOXYA1_FULL_44_5]